MLAHPLFFPLQRLISGRLCTGTWGADVQGQAAGRPGLFQPDAVLSLITTTGLGGSTAERGFLVPFGPFSAARFLSFSLKEP